jgi:type IV pilus assembly protein PilM
VDIGSRSTNILITDQGTLRVSSQTDFAGGTLTQAISNGLNIDVRRAEKLKKQRGLQGEGGERELSTLMHPYLDAIIGEVSKIKEKYEKTYNTKIERLILSGGTALLPGIEPYLKNQIPITIVRANPFSKIEYPPNLEPIIKDLGPILSVATGLGVRGLL